MDDFRAIYGNTTSAKERGYAEVLEEIQQYFAGSHTALFNEALDPAENEAMQKGLIAKYLDDHAIHVSEYPDAEKLTGKIYNDMAGFGVLNDIIYDPVTKAPYDGLEEVNVNSWEDIEVIYNGGLPQKTHIRFNSPEDAKNMFDRILSINGLKIDTMSPTLVTYLPGGIRVCVNQYPVVAKADGIAASIRIVRPNLLTTKRIIKENLASRAMLDLIRTLHSYGVSIAVSGGTSTGKTTFVSALLSETDRRKRIVVVEENTREINIVRRDPDGYIENSVVSLMTRPHHDPKYNLTASRLVERALTMNPDYIIIAEMKGEESVIAAEAAITGQVCITTIHANEAYLAYERMANLAMKQYALPKDVLLLQMVQAFPVVIQMEHSLNDRKRRVIEIVEATGLKDGRPVIHPLFRYDYATECFIQVEPISKRLQQTMLKKGLSKSALEQIMKGAAYGK